MLLHIVPLELGIHNFFHNHLNLHLSEAFCFLPSTLDIRRSTFVPQGKPCAVTFRSVGTQESQLPALPSQPPSPSSSLRSLLFPPFDIGYWEFDIRATGQTLCCYISFRWNSGFTTSSITISTSISQFISPNPFVSSLRHSTFGVRHSCHRASPVLLHFVPLELGIQNLRHNSLNLLFPAHLPQTPIPVRFNFRLSK